MNNKTIKEVIETARKAVSVLQTTPTESVFGEFIPRLSTDIAFTLTALLDNWETTQPTVRRSCAQNILSEVRRLHDFVRKETGGKSYSLLLYDCDDAVIRIIQSASALETDRP